MKQPPAPPGFSNELGSKKPAVIESDSEHTEKEKSGQIPQVARANCGETLQSAPLRRVEDGKEKEREKEEEI